jgi:acetylglutamate kinase
LENLFIVKVGGNVIDDEAPLSSFLKDFAAIPARKILVHGGGKLATATAEKLGIVQKMTDGRRITDAETLKVVTMVYAGYINKNIVAMLQSCKCNAMGLSGADGDLIPARKRQDKPIDFGFAGDIDSSWINVQSWQSLLDSSIVPVICPITHDGKGQLLNTNADTIAQELAKALGKEYNVTLIYVFEKPGVLLDTNDDSSVIPSITANYYQQLKKEQKIFAGMLPKLENAFNALNSGVKRVVIGKAGQLTGLIEGKSGTMIVNE